VRGATDAVVGVLARRQQALRAAPGAAGSRAGRREGGRLAGRREGGRLAGVIYLVLPRRGLWRVTAAPRSVARQTLPCHRSTTPVVATSSSRRATMHGAA